MTRIVVPGQMLHASIRAWNSLPVEKCIQDQILCVLEAALMELSKNPIQPTDEQIIAISRKVYSDMSLPSPEDEAFYRERTREFLIEWQRTMFAGERGKP